MKRQIRQIENNWLASRLQSSCINYSLKINRLNRPVKIYFQAVGQKQDCSLQAAYNRCTLILTHRQVKSKRMGTSLVLPWLRIHPQCRRCGSVPGWGTRLPHTMGPLSLCIAPRKSVCLNKDPSCLSQEATRRQLGLRNQINTYLF